jgi:tetratricopeptide (TPR) repeat protein
MGVAARAHGKIPSSVTWFRLAIDKSVSGNITTYYAQLAESCEDLGDYQGAIKAYRAAYNFSKDGIWLYQLARTYDIYYKDKSVALTYYEKYLESDDTISVARDYARNRLQDMGRF